MFWSSRYAELRGQGCTRIILSSRYADFEGNEGAPLRASKAQNITYVPDYDLF